MILGLPSPESRGDGSTSGRFDLVYTRYALHHFDAPQRFPEKAQSVPCPGRFPLIVDWVQGARTGVSERYYASQTVAGWMCGAGFNLLLKRVRRQSMVMVGNLPPAGVAISTGEGGDVDANL